MGDAMMAYFEDGPGADIVTGILSDLIERKNKGYKIR